MESDTYLTIKDISQGVYKEKGSRFLAFAFPIKDANEVKPIIDKLRKEHHEAKHHCFAYMLGKDRTIWRISDDGEPSGTAGRPILGQINSSGLTNILIVVCRYFGGTLLGVSGLINAYKLAAADAISNSDITEYTLHEYYEIIYPFISMNDVMKILKEEKAEQSNQVFDTECKICVNFRVTAKDRIIMRLERVNGLILKYIETR